MPVFKGLDSASSSVVSSIHLVDKRKPEKYALIVLDQLANVGINRVEAKLGLNDCARIVLNISKTAERAKSHRKECLYIADQAFQMLNAVDGGLKGRAIDVNQLLRDHVTRLKVDLEEIETIMKSFTSWWTVFRNLSVQRGLEKCQDLLEYDMEVFLLVLKTSLSNDWRNSKRRRAPAKLHPKARGPHSAWRPHTITKPPSKPPATPPQLIRKDRITKTPGATTTRPRMWGHSPINI